MQGIEVEKLSRAGIVGWLFLFAPLVGLGLLGFVLVSAVTQWREYTLSDWFWRFVWLGVIGLGLSVGLPAVGLKELERRRNQA